MQGYLAKGAWKPNAGSKTSNARSRYSSPDPFENNYFTEMCSGSEAGSYLRLIDFVYHSSLGLRVLKKKAESWVEDLEREVEVFIFFFMSDTQSL